MDKIKIDLTSKDDILRGINIALNNNNYVIARLLLNRFEKISGYIDGVFGKKDHYIKSLYPRDDLSDEKTIFDKEISCLLKTATLDEYVSLFLTRTMLPRVDNVPEKIYEKRNFCSIGSCFAREISYALANKNILCSHFDIEEEIASPFVFNNYLKLLFDDNHVQTEGGLFESVTDANRSSAKETLESATDIFVTFGVGVGPHDTRTGAPLNVKKDRLKLMLSNGAAVLRAYNFFEIQKDLIQILDFLQSLPNNPVIYLTLSPVPLFGFYGGVPKNVMTADAVSKSILRAAYDTYLRDNTHVIYIPTFELFKWVFPHTSENKVISKPFGGHDGAMRHPTREIVESVISHIIDNYVRATKG